MFINRLRRWLYEPSVTNIDVDDDKLLASHISVLKEKRLLRSAFETFYNDMSTLCDTCLPATGLEVELGSGAGFFKEKRSQLLTSDVRKSNHLDLELDAQNMALDNSSVRCVYAINVFHHLPDPECFLKELTRVLSPGGGCILVEPHNGFSSKLLHRHLHSDEHFDTNAKGWLTEEINGPMSGANQAMAHIVFQRDLERFKQLFGAELEIVHQGYVLNSLRYLFSGGLNFRQLLPSFMERPLAWLEAIGRPLARHWSLHQITVIRRRM